jgi:hypothetical protein
VGSRLTAGAVTIGADTPGELAINLGAELNIEVGGIVFPEPKGVTDIVFPYHSNLTSQRFRNYNL